MTMRAVLLCGDNGFSHHRWFVKKQSLAEAAFLVALRS